MRNAALKAAAVLAVATVGLGLYFAGLDDGIHHFDDQHGAHQYVITTAFPAGLWLSLPAAAAAVGLAWLLSSAAGAWLTGRPFRAVALVDALTYMPLAVLLIEPLRYVPRLAEFSSALFLFSTTLSEALLCVAVLLTATLKIVFFRRMGLRGELTASRWAGLSDRAVGWLVFAILMLFFSVALPQFSARVPFGGDQPHYLLVTHSLIEDGDIIIGDDYEEGAFRKFSSFSRIFRRPHRLTRDGEVVNPHKIGMPLLALPPYALAGKVGALLMIGFFAALAAANLYWLIVKIVPHRWAALAAVAWVVLSVPLLPMSFRFMTEIPTTAFMLLALNMIWQHDGRLPRWPWAIPFIIWFLPWLHTRGLVIGVGLTILLVVRLRSRPLLAVSLAAACALLALAVPAWNWWLYGEFGVLVEMAGAQQTELRVLDVFDHLGGLIFDAQFGFLLYNPAIVCAVVGCFPLWKRRPSALLWFFLLYVLAVAPGLTFGHWWGGSGPPARYAVPGMHLLAERGWRRWRWAALFGGACAVAVSLLMVSSVHMLTSSHGRTAPILTAVSVGRFDAVEWWPSWFAGAGQFWAQISLLALAVAVAVACVLLFAAAARRLGGGGDSYLGGALAAGAGLAAFLACLALYGRAAEQLVEGEPNGEQPLSRRLDLAYQWRHRHGGYRLVDQGGTLRPDSLPPRGFSASRLFSPWSLEPDRLAPRYRSYSLEAGEQELPLQPTTPLWAGRYRLELGLRAEGEGATVGIAVFDLSARGVTPRRPAAQVERRLSGEYRPLTIPIELPRNSLGLSVVVDSDRPLRFTHATLATLSLRRLESSTLPAELFDRAALAFNEYALYADLRAVHVPDGKWFWTRGDSEAAWTFVAHRPFDALRLNLVGRPGVEVAFSGDGWSRTFAFHGEERRATAELPLACRRVGDYWIAELRVRTVGRFVPARSIAGSTDHRSLGVHTRISLLRR